MKVSDFFSKFNIMLLSICLGVVFWVLDAISYSYQNTESSIFDSIFKPPVHDLVIRLLAFIFIGIIGIFAHRLWKLKSYYSDSVWKSNDQLKQISENINDVFWLISIEDNVLHYISPNFEKQWCISCEDLIKDPTLYFDRIHPDDKDLMRSRHFDREKRKDSQIEYRIIRPDGEMRWIWSRFITVFDDNDLPAYEIGVATDITERKMAEEDLRKSEKRFRTLVENARDVVCRLKVKPELKYEYMSPAVKTVIGASPEEFYDDPGLAFKLVHPDDLKKMQQAIKDPVSLENPVAMRGIDVNGNTVWTEHSIIPIYDKGELVALEAIMRDVTDRMLKQDELVRSKKYLENIINSIDDLVFVLDKNGIFSDFQQPSKYHDLYLPVDQFVGKSYKETLPRELVVLIDSVFDKVIYEDSVEQIDHTLDINGKIRYCSARLSPLRDSNNDIFGLTVVSRDVTDRVEIETALRESEERHREVVENAGDGIMVIRDKKIIFVNDRVSELLGYSREETIGTGFDNYIHPDYLNLGRQTYGKLEAGKKVPPISEIKIMHKDGRGRWFESNSVLVKWDNEPAILHFFRDITERRKIEDKHQELMLFHKGILGSMPHGLFIIDSSQIITWVNSSMRGMFNNGPNALGDLTGKHLSLIFTESNKAEDFWREMYQSLETKSWDVREVQLKSSNDSELWCQISSVFYDNSNPNKGIICTATDISSLVDARRKEIENQKKLMHTDRLSSVGRLAAGVAHEINNPLAALYGMIQELNDDPISCDSEKTATMIKVSRRIQVIVHNLLMFSHQDEQIKTKGLVNDVINETLLMLSAKLRRESIELILNLDENQPQIKMSAGQLQQVFLNVVFNAIDAMPDGGKLQVTTLQADDKVEIVFKDNGCGMKSEILDKIFLPFFTTKEVGKGTGLGLSISYGILEEHNGQISAQSEPHNGTEFIISIPVFRDN